MWRKLIWEGVNVCVDDVALLFKCDLLWDPMSFFRVYPLRRDIKRKLQLLPLQVYTRFLTKKVKYMYKIIEVNSFISFAVSLLNFFSFDFDRVDGQLSSHKHLYIQLLLTRLK